MYFFENNFSENLLNELATKVKSVKLIRDNAAPSIINIDF